MNKRFLAFIAIVLGLMLSATLIGGAFYAGIVYQRHTLAVVPAPGLFDNRFDVLAEVVDSIRESYVDKVPEKKLVQGSIDGVIKALNDPYTRYLPGSHFKSFNEETSGKFGGVGMELGSKDHALIVVAPIKGSPAEKAGVTAGDTILRIDKRHTKNMALPTAVKLIRGDPGTKVALKFKRENGKVYEVTITRAQIKTPNVSSKLLDGDIGYVNVHQFSSSSGDDVKAELQTLLKKGAKGIVLDLRNNPGGLLNEAVSLAGVFIESGPIVKVKQRNGMVDVLEAPGGANADIPLVVLANKGSASASEIVAGAVQDRNRGKVVGETTFGKGSVQTVIPLKGGAGLLLTTAKYLTPKNRSLHKVGTKPDVMVKMGKNVHYLGKNDAQLNKAKEILRSRM